MYSTTKHIHAVRADICFQNCEFCRNNDYYYYLFWYISVIDSVGFKKSKIIKIHCRSSEIQLFKVCRWAFSFIKNNCFFFFKSPIFLQNRWFFENVKTSKSSIFLINDRNSIIFDFLKPTGLVLCACKVSVQGKH